MKRLALIGFALLIACCQSYAQEASSGINIRANVSAQLVASNKPTQNPRDGSPVVLGSRTTIYPTIKLSDRWFAAGAMQIASRPYFYQDLSTPGFGAKGNLLQATLNYSRVSNSRSLLARAGEMPSAFGAFLLRYDDTENPLVDVPPAYGYYYVPISFQAVAGAQVDATAGKFDGRIQFANSSPANPRSIFSHDQYGNWAGGGGFTIRQGLRVGVSGYRGPYLDRHYAYYFPGEAAPSKLRAHGIGVDAGWERSHTRVYIEGQKFVMPYSLFPNFRESTAYGEVRQVLTPRWFIAGRFGYTSSNVSGKLYSIETGGAFRPNRLQLVKFAYEEQLPVSGFTSSNHTLGIQFITTLQRSFAYR